MSIHPAIPQGTPVQRLPREAYISQDWYDREQEMLFGRNWTFAGLDLDLPEAGDFKTVKAGPFTMFVVRDNDGNLRAFHNICRHRGTELVEGKGNCGRTIVCPYHNWVYNLDGRLRGVPAQKECFPDLDKAQNALLPASLGVYRNMVFVHPQPDVDFTAWLSNLDSVPWPHDLTDPKLQESLHEVVYEMNCNWKVFFENAVDGYHLAYLHKQTLGGPLHDKNIWETFGPHLIWWSTEREGVKHRIPQFIENAAKGSGMKVVPGADQPGYGGIYIIFPTTILAPNPWGFSISTLEPIAPDKTLMRVRSWSPKGWFSYDYRPKDIPGFDPASGLIKSSHWTKHPLDTGDFQTEDVWVCEKMQRALQSPNHAVAHLARGSGGEAAIEFFQQTVLGEMEG